MRKQMTSCVAEMVHSSKHYGRCDVVRLQMRIAKVVHCRAALQGPPSEMLEPYDGKLSRTVLRRESGREARDLSDG